MIISDKQQQANQQNAQHSTGPKSPEGKAAIRFNALTHGLRTRATILPGENAEDYYKLWDELEADWQPQNRTELCHLETMVTSQWLLARVAQSESRIYARIILGDKQSGKPGASRSPRKPRKQRKPGKPRPRRCPPLAGPTFRTPIT